MNSIWVLSVTTSLPFVYESAEDLKTETLAFKNFDDAKKALNEKLDDLAFSGGAMFDDDGYMVNFKNYVKTSLGSAKNADDNGETLNHNVASRTFDALMSVFEGTGYDISELKGYYTDYLIGIEFNDDTMIISGAGEGPRYGYNPKIATNMFDMSKEKDYYLYIDDRLGQYEPSSLLFIDLKRVEVE